MRAPGTARVTNRPYESVALTGDTAMRVIVVLLPATKRRMSPSRSYPWLGVGVVLVGVNRRCSD